MQIGSATLEKKLLSYSLAAGAVLAGAGNTQAGIWGQSVNHTLNLGQTLTISFNENARFKLRNNSYAGEIKASTSAANWAGTSCLIAAKQLFPNDKVDGVLNPFTRNNGNYGCIFSASGNFGQGADRYIGVKFKIGSDLHYGWIKINVPNYPHTSWTIVSYAYEQNKDTFITCDGALPVELTSFSAALNGRSVELKWNTATEINNYGFEIERNKFPELNKGQKEEISSWEKIGFLEGRGNSNSPLNYGFTDPNPPQGMVMYRLKQIDIDGKSEYSKIVEVVNNTVEKFELMQNYPNPFNPSTKIKFSLPESGLVSLKVYNSLGQEVSTLINKELEAGTHEADFNASGLPSGMYVYKISAGKYSAVKKMLMIK